jgi:hypothetical protein
MCYMSHLTWINLITCKEDIIIVLKVICIYLKDERKIQRPLLPTTDHQGPRILETDSPLTEPGAQSTREEPPPICVLPVPMSKIW